MAAAAAAAPVETEAAAAAPLPSPQGRAPGDWVCRLCGNNNFGRNRVCNTARCSQSRGANKAAAAGLQPTAWPEQSKPERIAANHALRARLAADDPTLTAEERARAVMLQARSDRKKGAKAARAAGAGTPGGKAGKKKAK